MALLDGQIYIRFENGGGLVIKQLSSGDCLVAANSGNFSSGLVERRNLRKLTVAFQEERSVYYHCPPEIANAAVFA